MASRNAPRNAGYRFLGFLGHLLLFFYVFRVKLASIMVESFPLLPLLVTATQYVGECMYGYWLSFTSWCTAGRWWKSLGGCYDSWCHSQYHYIIAVGGPWTCMQSGECCYCSNHSSVCFCIFKDCVSSFSWFACYSVMLLCTPTLRSWWSQWVILMYTHSRELMKLVVHSYVHTHCQELMKSGG